MSDPDLATLLAEVERLVLPHFDHHTAWDLGSAMNAQALTDGLPVVISVPLTPAAGLHRTAGLGLGAPTAHRRYLVVHLEQVLDGGAALAGACS